MYNAAADMWQEVRSELATAMTLTGASNDAWRTFWAAQQRFFKLLCVSMKVPAVVALAKEALVNGSCVVIGLQSTGIIPSPLRIFTCLSWHREIVKGSTLWLPIDHRHMLEACALSCISALRSQRVPGCCMIRAPGLH